MAVIMATALSWLDGGLDYTIHERTLAETPAHTHRLGEPASGGRTFTLTYFSFRNSGRSKYESWKSG